MGNAMDYSIFLLSQSNMICLTVIPEKHGNTNFTLVSQCWFSFCAVVEGVGKQINGKGYALFRRLIDYTILCYELVQNISKRLKLR